MLLTKTLLALDWRQPQHGTGEPQVQRAGKIYVQIIKKLCYPLCMCVVIFKRWSLLKI